MDTTLIFKRNLEQIKLNKKVIVNEGGQHSSKTYSILQLLIFLSQSCKNKIFTIVGESIPFLKVGAQRQFLEILQNENLFDENMWNGSDRVYKMGTNIFEFKAYDVPSKALGAKRHFLFINEVINIPYETYQNLEGRTDILTFVDYNPSFEFFIHQKVLQQNNVGYVHSTYKDNKYLPQKIVETIERYKEYDLNRWNVMGLGVIGSNDGLVFNNWNIIDNFPSSEKITYGMDFGFTNDPSTCISVFKQGGELYVDEIFYGLGMTNADISDMMVKCNLRKRYDEIYADSAEPKSIDELHKRGWNIKGATKGPDSVMKGIDLMKQYKINVSKRSINLIKELRQYQWLKDRDGQLTNKAGGADHLIDALRYAIMSMDNKSFNHIRIR